MRNEVIVANVPHRVEDGGKRLLQTRNQSDFRHIEQCEANRRSIEIVVVEKEMKNLIDVGNAPALALCAPRRTWIVGSKLLEVVAQVPSNAR